MDYNKLHKELNFRTSRASGSGGQHVNKVSTKVELVFDVEGSNILEDSDKASINKRLRNRINKSGQLIVSSEKSRSQLLNKSNAIKKFDKLIHEAVNYEEIKRTASSFKANKKKRLKQKKKHAEKKSMRKKIDINSAKDL